MDKCYVVNWTQKYVCFAVKIDSCKSYWFSVTGNKNCSSLSSVVKSDSGTSE